jgi:methylenetetrahydrofolate dehydrogenase (NADP+)/methenyltetrahydrofolate cyclohydrolase
MTIDGRAIAEDLYAELAETRRTLSRDVTLGILVVGGNAVIDSFVRIKRKAAERLGVTIGRIDLPHDTTTEAVVEAVQKLAAKSDAIIVQLPLPSRVDTNAVLSEIPRDKDVDAINPAVSDGDRVVQAPVALAVMEVLRRTGIKAAGKKTVVVGAGRLVGAPSTSLLRRAGAHVSVFTLDEGSMDDLKDADVVVLGAGNPGFVKPLHLKKGVVLIDAGASESAGKVVGDADPACAYIASVFTPVPGGIGPIAVAMIFRNLFALVERHG